MSALNTAVQVDVDALLGASVHAGVTVAVEPAGWLVTLKSTVPTGALFVPEAVSVTVTVQLAGLFAAVEAGQSSVVEVERFAGFRATSCATHGPPIPSVAVFGPVGPAVACVKSALMEWECVLAPPAPPESTSYLSVMSSGGVRIVLNAVP